MATRYKIKKSILNLELETLKKYMEGDFPTCKSGLAAVLALLDVGEFAMDEDLYGKLPEIIKNHFEKV